MTTSANTRKKAQTIYSTRDTDFLIVGSRNPATGVARFSIGDLDGKVPPLVNATWDEAFALLVRHTVRKPSALVVDALRAALPVA